MVTSMTDLAKGRPTERRPHLLALAIRELTRLELLNIGVMLLCFAIVTVAFLISWAAHDAAVMMQTSKIGTFAMGSVIMLGVLKFCKEYWRPVEA